MATDGHNRVFYSGMVGNLWAIRGLRVEDARRADAACESQPAWAAELPCFDGVLGSVRVAYAATSAMGQLGLASEWLAAGAMPFGTPYDLEVLTQDEIGGTLELVDFYKTYGRAFLDDRTPDEEGIYTLDVRVQVDLSAGPGRRDRAESGPRDHARRRRDCPNGVKASANSRKPTTATSGSPSTT